MTIEPPEAGSTEPAESAKRRQIIEGARQVFLDRGFDAASMGEIAREAGVSKGTLYVYFDSKEALFAAIVEDSKRETAERVAVLDIDDADVEAVLRAFANRLLAKLTAPRHIALVRMVIAISGKLPELARIYNEAGPIHGRRCLAAYLDAQVARGRLVIEDTDLAAAQFFGLCNHPTISGILIAGEPAPDAERRAVIADRAVATFLAAYAAEPVPRHTSSVAGSSPAGL